MEGRLLKGGGGASRRSTGARAGSLEDDRMMLWAESGFRAVRNVTLQNKAGAERERRKRDFMAEGKAGPIPCRKARSGAKVFWSPFDAAAPCSGQEKGEGRREEGEGGREKGAGRWDCRNLRPES